MRQALLVVDMLNDFISGSLKCEEARKVVPNIKRLVEHFRKSGAPVVYLCDTHYPGVDRELELWGEHAIAGTWGAEVVEDLRPEKGDFVIRKRRYSGFFETDLDLLLRELKVEGVVLTGIDTSICVRHTAADAYFRGYSVVIVKDAVASWGGTEENERGIKYIVEIYGAKSLTTEELIGSNLTLNA
ncbi:MAG: isochorismatase family cysteine hydrolase [Candidatus Verstraetearchaeota archaeon]|nr:isochorismatase family cysteine hydrolase [Candidatus Verstraetearchaeota archaeon]